MKFLTWPVIGLVGAVLVMMLVWFWPTPLPAGAVSIVTSKKVYAVGEAVVVGIQNQTAKTVFVENDCPREPFDLYRWNNGRWTEVKVSAADRPCASEDRAVAIEAGQLRGTSLTPWATGYALPGRYRLMTSIERYRGRVSTEFEVRGE